MRRRVRLTEGDLHRIVKESVNNILKENNAQPSSSAIFDELWNEICTKYSDDPTSMAFASIDLCQVILDRLCYHFQDLNDERWKIIGKFNDELGKLMDNI